MVPVPMNMIWVRDVEWLDMEVASNLNQPFLMRVEYIWGVCEKAHIDLLMKR